MNNVLSMKKLALTAIVVVVCSGFAAADKLVLLHTNDTHSQITPTENALGGIMRRKVIVDSVRAEYPDVLLIDAGDAVQGTLYYTLYGGEAEMKAMNALGYDLAILGNHDFDNGIENLAENLRNSNATWITTNYDIAGSALDGLLVPYVINEYDGKRVAFMGINLNPEGMISTRNYPGVKYLDIYKAANSTAWSLRHNEKADLVVAITHIGYDDPALPDDIDLARSSEDIDIIIGGHSHTKVSPDDDSTPYLIKNKNGRDVVVAQTGARGESIGEIVVRLDELGADEEPEDIIEYRLISVDSRFDGHVDATTADMLHPYKSRIDSLYNIRVAKTTEILEKPWLANLFADLIAQRGKQLVDDKRIDLALINNGGIRNVIPAGDISLANVMMTLPFDNRIEVIDVSGADLEKAFDAMLARSITGVSKNVDITTAPDGSSCASIMIDGRPIDPERIYRLATIDYLADGGDYLSSLKNGTKIARSPKVLYEDMSDMMRRIKGKIKPSKTLRVHP